MKTKIVSIIGRPNVGKSTIFNRLTKSKRRSLTFDTPGVTRDGHYGLVTLDEVYQKDVSPQSFLLVDTGGFYVDHSKVVDAGINDEEILWDQVAEQSLTAIKESDFCLVVADIRDGLMPADEEIIKMLRQTGKLFWLLLNKCDSSKQELDIADFSKLGLDEDEIFLLSAEHDIGFDSFKTNLQLLLNTLETSEGDLLVSNVVPQYPLVGSLAIIGAPNVGKSTLLNQLLGMERSIVSPVAGTTVDPVEAYLTMNLGEAAHEVDDFWLNQDQDYLGSFAQHKKYDQLINSEEQSCRSILILDTAGIRRQSSVDGFIETQSVYRSLRCLTDASLVLYIIDAYKGLTHHDRHLIGLSLEKGKTIFLLLNKFDLVKKKLKEDGREVSDWLEHWQQMVPWLEFCEMIPLSARTGEGVAKIRARVKEFFINRAKAVSTGELNRVIQSLIDAKPLNFHEGKGVTLKLKYASLVKNFPPTILLFTNKSQNIPVHYRRYLVNGIREGMDWKNTPVHLIFRTNSDREKREAEMFTENEL
jgi:GTP-binding protein